MIMKGCDEMSMADEIAISEEYGFDIPIKMKPPPDYWTTKDGVTMRVSNMTTRHIINVINMLRRQIDGSAHDDFVYDNIDAMQKELKRRNVNYE